MSEPSGNGPDGRDALGRFSTGNPGGPGNPFAPQVARLRGALLRAVAEEDVQAVVAKLVELAKDGNVPAAREVLDRALGRSGESADLLERLERLEQLLDAAETRRAS